MQSGRVIRADCGRRDGGDQRAGRRGKESGTPLTASTSPRATASKSPLTARHPLEPAARARSESKDPSRCGSSERRAASDNGDPAESHRFELGMEQTTHLRDGPRRSKRSRLADASAHYIYDNDDPDVERGRVLGHQPYHQSRAPAFSERVHYGSFVWVICTEEIYDSPSMLTKKTLTRSGLSGGGWWIGSEGAPEEVQ